MLLTNKLYRANTLNRRLTNPVKIEPISEKADQSIGSKQSASENSQLLKSSSFHLNIMQKHESFKNENNYAVANELENGSYFGEVSISNFLNQSVT